MSGTKSLDGCRVLVVEDEYFIADEMRRAIQAAGGAVEGPYPDVDQALSVVRDGACDVAVLDVNLRGEMVYPLAEALQWKGIPFVFATGYELESVPDRLKGIPVWQKPIVPTDLVSNLAMILDPSRPS